MYNAVGSAGGRKTRRLRLDRMSVLPRTFAAVLKDIPSRLLVSFAYGPGDKRPAAFVIGTVGFGCPSCLFGSQRLHTTRDKRRDSLVRSRALLIVSAPVLRLARTHANPFRAISYKFNFVFRRARA